MNGQRNCWKTKDNAGLRPALFFELVPLDLAVVQKQCILLKQDGLLENADSIIDSFYNYLLELIDAFFAPFVITEIDLQKERLTGKNPAYRYASFFLTQDLKWHPGALLIEKKYASQLNFIQKFLQKEIEAFVCFLKRLNRDYPKLKEMFFPAVGQLKKIQFHLSDRHNFQGSCLLLTFDKGYKLIYKPKSPVSDILFRRILDVLKLPREFEIRTPVVLARQKYGWHQYLPYRKYAQDAQLKKVYKRIGTLLALCDVLNYTDGHSENFVCSKQERFCLIDTETLLTNLSYFQDKTKHFYHLSFTGIIPQKGEKRTYLCAVRSQKEDVYFPFSPCILNDCTDKISLTYRRLSENENEKSLPFKQALSLKKYLPDMVEGLRAGYAAMAIHADAVQKILQEDKQIYFRQLIRPTLYYIWVMHKFLHPQTQQNQQYLKQALSNVPSLIEAYEKQFVAYANVPVFYHTLFDRHLYGVSGQLIVPDYFQQTSYEWVCRKLKDVQNPLFVEKRVQEMQNALK